MAPGDSDTTMVILGVLRLAAACDRRLEALQASAAPNPPSKWRSLYESGSEDAYRKVLALLRLHFQEDMGWTTAAIEQTEGERT